ncbi:hypothetical protein [Ralstonia sp. SET104]|uniref:hypothetical protein n=1 Tax=Ralstonia sp. SET104 TaxID=2448774 RepID=UPI000F58AF46|nr:hypothetical protein [Ralstonia sp. SET104]
MPFEWPHPEFRFRSSRDWEQVPGDDPTRLQLYCPETRTTITLSMDPYKVPPEKFEATARFLLETRKKAYVDGVRHLLGQDARIELSYTNERVQSHSTGTGWEISYEGMGSGRSFFGFLGYVTSRKIVNLFVETPLSFTPGRREMYQEVIGGFEVTLP